ncbi:hypothetical protein SCHPADRAFT_890369 [Schizopora paradoxa]|uniref:Uncharacterized protein n=1 Tax=Schizopora paradoxa TaxID=27342 RepID=A0A0H2RM08_9AGAM|nr:hypothetical protein SCHPADRAFT_890369 [Schizopora paradoxa]
MSKFASSDIPFDSAAADITLLAKPTEDVTFTPATGGAATVLKASEASSSREAVGVWRVKGKVWKVFSYAEKDNGKTQIMKDLEDDYYRASNEGLPMGSPTFQRGKVQIGKAIATDGFVLITDDMVGTNFQKTNSSFIAALTKEKVPKNKDDADYKKILAGCNAAMKVGLKDCQGFIKTGIYEPLRFIDVHTGWNKSKGSYDYSEQAVALVDAITAWPTSK